MSLASEIAVRPSSTSTVTAASLSSSPEPSRRPWLAVREDWLRVAAKLPGKALHVGLAVWWCAAHSECPHVLLTREAGVAFGLSRDCVYDALTRLSAAGLVLVDRQRGRHPVVSLLDHHGQFLAPRLTASSPFPPQGTPAA